MLMQELNPFIVYAALAAIFLLNIFLFNQQHHIMEANEAILAYAQRIDTATNNIAAELRDARAVIAEQGATTEALATLDKSIAALEGTGKNPEVVAPEQTA